MCHLQKQIKKTFKDVLQTKGKKKIPDGILEI